MAREKMQLKETKGTFKAVGKVTRIDKDNAYDQDTQTKGEHVGRTYRKLRFGVKTSETNEITVQMFAYEPKDVFMWNSKLKEEDENYKGTRKTFEDWEENQEQYREEGYVVMQSRVGLHYDDKNKLVSKGVPKFVTAKMVYDNLNNGDFVTVEGTISYGSYEKDGQKVKTKNFNIEKVHLAKELDFDAEDFEEITYFEQQFVYVDSELNKTDKKLYITGRVIDFNKKFQDAQFVIDFNNGEGGVDEEMKQFAENFKKTLKFGDVVKTFGDNLNRVIIKKVENEDNKKADILGSLGGRSKPSHAENSKTYVNQLSINGVDSLDEKVYREADFVVDNLVEGLGGKQKKTENPWKDDVSSSSDEPIDISDTDDLPF
ncbi:hypothetical protein Q7A53_05490 [Halobacillus rhizosphaerae]|uniref:hypothetical protein n=1 Tax=Halobacillus rhizosphaerae TaxID=3064889 RepID=UPI00398AAE5D